MIRLAFIASLLFVSAAGLPAQQKDAQQQDKQQSDQKSQQQGQQEGQQQSEQNQQDSDAPPVPSESTSKKARAENDKGGKDATPDQPPAISSDAEKAKADATYNPLPAQQDI